MTTDENDFVVRVETLLRKLFQNNARPEPEASVLGEFTVRLWQLVLERGLPRPLPTAERGEPGGMSEGEMTPLVSHLTAGLSDPLLIDAAKQLLKACFYPEFKTCRNSFREVSPDGSCRRQELARVRGRLSGAHCVDCPYWTSLTSTQHEKFLARSWLAGPAVFAANRDIYLPEEFRSFRVWLHSAARDPARKFATLLPQDRTERRS